MTARREVRLICNPTAHKGRALTELAPVQRILAGHGWSVEAVVTSSGRHAEEAAAEVDPDVLLVALGGDGLVARVATGALISGACVAPLPAGRGHDLMRALGAPADVRVAAEYLPVATERRIDVGMAGGTAYLGVATIGYDSLANAYANAAPGIVPSGLVYAYGGLRALWQTRPETIALVVDGVDRSFRGWNIAIGNSGRYGAGMKVNPIAVLDDGELDVTVIGELPRRRYPALLPKLYTGDHIDGLDVRQLRGREIRVDAPADRIVYADGDEIGRTPMTFTVRHRALRILAA